MKSQWRYQAYSNPEKKGLNVFFVDLVESAKSAEIALPIQLNRQKVKHIKKR